MTRVALAGLGAVGAELARAITHDLGTATVTAVAVRDVGRARALLDALGCDAAIVPLDELGEHADVVIEALPPELLREVAAPALERGVDVVVLSCGALLDAWDLVDVAAANGARLHVPSGAVLGLDGIRAAAEGPIRSVRIVTRKPVAGLLGGAYVTAHHPDLADLTAARLVFAGSARAAIAHFPANVNVAVAVSLAGIGPDRTQVEIHADPTVTRNTHLIEVDAEAARFSITVEGVPSANPRTGRLTALSVLALLRARDAPLRIGT
jgi:aspartate dehydrogenase